MTFPSPYGAPPPTGNPALDDYLLRLHILVNGLNSSGGTLNGDNITGFIDAAMDLAVTGLWTFTTHPLGLDHLQIANIGTKTHDEIDTHLALTNLDAHGGIATGAITIADLSNALNSGDYSIQLKDNLSTNDYGIKIGSNIRHDKLVQISSGGEMKMLMRATTGMYGTFTFDASAMNASFGSLNFISPGPYATISFTTGANSLGFNPGVNAVTTNNTTTINFAANNGSVALASFDTTAWLPISSYDAAQDLGAPAHPFKDFYQIDNGKHYFGDAQDASIYYDGTDLIVNPKLVGTGALKMSGDVSMNANNLVLDTTTGTKIGTVGGSSGQKLAVLGATPIVQQLLPTGAGKTVDDVITVLQNFGIARQI